MEKLPMNMWAKEDLPSEKALQGFDRLSNTEILSILIGTGTKNENAIDLARKVLGQFDNNLSAIAKCDIDTLSKIPGIGKSKATRILAALELGKRRQATNNAPKDLMSATRIYNYMLPMMQDLDVEEFWVLLMNHNFKLIKPVRISRGGITEVSVDIRIVMREAVLNNATILAAVHNHPSGSLKPSKADDMLTNSLNKACELMRIKFLDHVIVTDGNYYSYHETGKI